MLLEEEGDRLAVRSPLHGVQPARRRDRPCAAAAAAAKLVLLTHPWNSTQACSCRYHVPSVLARAAHSTGRRAGAEEYIIGQWEHRVLEKATVVLIIAWVFTGGAGDSRGGSGLTKHRGQRDRAVRTLAGRGGRECQPHDLPLALRCPAG